MPAAKRSPSSPVENLTSDRIRRRRVTTACIICRDRRVKCDRVKPKCTQCSRGSRECKYVDDGPSSIKFIAERQGVEKTPQELTPDPPSTGPDSVTWRTVIEAQTDLVKEKQADGGKVPTWAVAEVEEPLQVQAAQLPHVPRPYVIKIEALGDSFWSTLVNASPPRAVCQRFFESYLLGVQPVVPVCHVPTLKQEYADFWTHLSPNTSVETLVLVLAVLYTGASNFGLSAAQEATFFRHLYNEIFTKMDISSYQVRNVAAAMQLLQGHLIFNTYQASLLAPFSAFGFMPQTVRFAQILHLHAEPRGCTPIEEEVRKRLWWHVVFLDMESIVANGLPPIIRPDRYTASFPSLLRDDLITEHRSTDKPLDARYFSTMMVAMRGQYQWAYHVQVWFEKLPSEKEVQTFKDVINDLIRQVPDDGSTENTWTRAYLKMQIDRGLCMLGLRFWQLDQYEKTGCQSEVIRTARSLLTHYLDLSSLPTPTLNLEWFIPGLIQPLHALIILLMHLSTCPSVNHSLSTMYNNTPNPCLPIRTLLDTVQSLRVKRVLAGMAAPPKALIPQTEWPQRTSPRYLILVHLRKRVWRKLGWDRDGEGLDPWGGRLEVAEAEEWKMAQEGEGEWKRLRVRATEKAGEAEGEAERELVEGWSQDMQAGNWGMNLGMGMAMGSNVDVDPMTVLAWEEWERLSQGLFAS